jgi:rubrerythrin
MAVSVETREQAARELVAGAAAKGEYRCTGCGYGVTVYSRLPRCPMCGTEDAWEQVDFGRAFREAFGEGPTLP